MSSSPVNMSACRTLHGSLHISHSVREAEHSHFLAVTSLLELKASRELSSAVSRNKIRNWTQLGDVLTKIEFFFFYFYFQENFIGAHFPSAKIMYVWDECRQHV